MKLKTLIFDSSFQAVALALFYFSIAPFIPSVDVSANFIEENNMVIPYFLIFMGLGIVSALALNVLNVNTLGRFLFDKLNPGTLWVSYWKIVLLFSFFATIVHAVLATEASFIKLIDESGFLGAARLFKSLFNPNFAILSKALLAIIETIFIAFLATVLAIPLAFVMSFIGAKNVMKSKPAFAVYFVVRTFFNIVRSVEPLIWAIVFSVWVGIGPFAGMLALMIHSVASLTKQFSEIVECISDGPVEAIQATGARPFQVIQFGMVPQIVLPYISFAIYRWDINVRMATIIGLVGGGGIGTMLIQYQGQALWREVGCLIFVIALVVWIMDTASAYIREAIK